MERGASLAIFVGMATFPLLRGRMVQGDVAVAVISAVYLVLVVAITVLHREWTLLARLVHPAYLLTVSSAALWMCFVVYRISPLHPLHKFPGPVLNRITELPMAYAAARLVRHRYLCELHDKYGPVVRTAPHSISINSKSAVHTIYKSAQCFNKTDAYDLHLKGEGVFFVKDREQHAVRRRSWNRALSRDAIKEYIEPLFQTVQAFVDRLAEDTKARGSVNLVRITTQWAFDTATLITFGGNGTEMSLLGSDDPDEFADKPRDALMAFEFFSHLPWLFHILKHLPSAVFRQVEEFSLNQAEHRLRAEKIHFRDIFSYWIEDAEHVNLDELATESLAAIIAATETVGSMTSLVFYFILSSPQWKESLRCELDKTFDARLPLSPSSADKLDSLPVLNAVIQEAFRAGSIFSGLNRVVPAGGATIDGYCFPEGTLVSVPTYAQHLREDHFGPETSVFNPNRWLVGGSKADKGALLTFSAGPFGCVGQKLAYKQTRLILACMFLLLDIELTEGFDKARFWAGVGNLRATVIKGPLDVVARRRDPATQVIFPSA